MRFCRVAMVVSRPSEPSTTRSGAGCRSAASIVALRILLGSQAQRPLLLPEPTTVGPAVGARVVQCYGSSMR